MFSETLVSECHIKNWFRMSRIIDIVSLLATLLWLHAVEFIYVFLI